MISAVLIGSGPDALEPRISTRNCIGRSVSNALSESFMIFRLLIFLGVAFLSSHLKSLFSLDIINQLHNRFREKKWLPSLRKWVSDPQISHVLARSFHNRH